MCSIRDFFPIENRIGGTKPKKNFILENRKYVTKLAKTNQAIKENENPSNKSSFPQKQKFKLRQDQSKDLIPENINKQVKSIDFDKIDASIKALRSVLAKTKVSQTQEKLNIKHQEKIPLAFRNQAVQTIYPYNEEDILKDSVIRYPKLRNSDKAKIIQTKHMNTIAVQTESSESENHHSVDKKTLKSIQQQNEINLNSKQTNLVKLKENASSHHQLGEIPKYLKNRKTLKDKNEKEIQKKLAIKRELGLDDPSCPPGHILLPELERLEHLTKIKKDYDRLVMQLNMLPVSSDSYMIKEKRKHLEEELDKLQLGIKLFSKKKLYVKVNPKTTDS